MFQNISRAYEQVRDYVWCWVHRKELAQLSSSFDASLESMDRTNETLQRMCDRKDRLCLEYEVRTAEIDLAQSRGRPNHYIH